MNSEQIDQAISILRAESRQWKLPSVSVIADQFHSPFHVLISCIISLRTKDAVTSEASSRLFKHASTPVAIAKLKPEKIAELIYPAGFYRNKSVQICEICQRLHAEFGGIVPADINQLLDFKGVGRKTANLVLTLGHGLPGICVDIHVHRITNRWGYVKSKTPDMTEAALREKLPEQYWLEINDLLVSLGQNICFPISPACSRCPLIELCDRVGVTRSR